MKSQYEQMRINRRQAEIERFEESIEFFESQIKEATSMRDIKIYDQAIGHMIDAIHRVKNQD